MSEIYDSFQNRPTKNILVEGLSNLQSLKSLYSEFKLPCRQFYRPFIAYYVCSLHCKYLNARSECNDIVISVYGHYPLDPNAKSSDTKCITLSIRWFCIRIERVMTVYGNYDVIAFRSCIQILTVYCEGGRLYCLLYPTAWSQ